MKKSIHRQHLLTAALVAAWILLVPLSVSAQTSSDTWEFAITPYVWIPDIDGKLKYSRPPGEDGRPEVEVGPDSYLESLDFAAMVSGEVRKGKWSAVTDVIYLDFSDEESFVKSVDFVGVGNIPVNASLDAGTETSLRAWEWTLAGGYDFLQGQIFTLGAIAGFRYLRIEASTDWNLAIAITRSGPGVTFSRSGSVSGSQELWDGIVGARGRLRLGSSNFFVPYYVDVGTGSSNLTWQGMIGLAYAFKRIDIMGVYRHLQYDVNDEDLVQDMRFSGPALGLRFRF